MQYILFRYGRERKEAAIETIKLSAIIIALFLISYYIPLASLGIILTPGIFGFITYRNGMAFTALGTIVVAIATFLILPPLSGIYIVGIFAGVGLALGEFTYRKKSAPLAIFAGATVFILNILLLMFIESKITGIDIIDYIVNLYRQQLELAVATTGTPIEINRFLIEIRRMFPGIVFSIGMIMSAINYLLLGNIIMKALNKRKTALLSEFTLPGNIFGGILIIYLLSFILMSSDFIYKETLAINLGIILSLLFFMQGIAAIYYFLHTRTKPFVRNLIMITLCLVIPLYSFVVAIGFVEAIFNFRRIKR